MLQVVWKIRILYVNLQSEKKSWLLKSKDCRMKNNKKIKSIRMNKRKNKKQYNL